MNNASKHPLFYVTGLVLLSAVLIVPAMPGRALEAKPKAEYVFNLTAPVVSKDLAYQDEVVKMAFAINRADIVVSVSNLAKSSIKVNWGEVAYVDAFGQSHNMTHSEQPAVLPPTAITNDTMVPADFIYSYNTGKVTLWQRRDFFPRPTKKEARKYDGRSFSLYIPIEINGEIKNYLLTFTIRLGLAGEVGTKQKGNVGPLGNASQCSGKNALLAGLAARNCHLGNHRNHFQIGTGFASRMVRRSAPSMWVSQTEIATSQKEIE